MLQTQEPLIVRRFETGNEPDAMTDTIASSDHSEVSNPKKTVNQKVCPHRSTFFDLKGNDQDKVFSSSHAMRVDATDTAKACPCRASEPKMVSRFPKQERIYVNEDSPLSLSAWMKRLY